MGTTCVRKRAHNSAPRSAKRERGVSVVMWTCGRGGGRHRIWRVALLLRIGRRCPSHLRGRKIGGIVLPRARAEPSAGLVCRARLRAHPGDDVVQVIEGQGKVTECGSVVSTELRCDRASWYENGTSKRGRAE